MAGEQYMTLDELTLIFGYKNNEQTKRALSRKTLKLPTYKIRGRIVADPAVVTAWFAKQRAEGLAKLASEQ
jgi:hypothetical protein